MKTALNSRMVENKAKQTLLNYKKTQDQAIELHRGKENLLKDLHMEGLYQNGKSNSFSAQACVSFRRSMKVEGDRDTMGSVNTQREFLPKMGTLDRVDTTVSHTAQQVIPSTPLPLSNSPTTSLPMQATCLIKAKQESCRRLKLTLNSTSRLTTVEDGIIKLDHQISALQSSIIPRDSAAMTAAICGLVLIRMFHQATLDWTWPVVLLGLLTGIASSAPIATKARGSLEGRWETLLSRSLYPISGRKLDLGWDRDYFTGIKRVRRLYCNVGIGFHLQITADGQINGAHTENQYSLLMISTVELGVVSLYGVKTHAFIAMNSRGRLYATADFNNECKFRERLLPNRYNVYESKTYPGMYIALSKHGRAKRGSKVSPILRVTHFLPRL
ncbi:uncharacterized protein LOC121282005 [Carcharodon carcharias]|uniref:uncharacterized protein LOC121282005 n=1 Tax=Carcharodon carcharias TaxID=13397 RepID=UPI001B7E0578|nr:uncharacterized protein LOC121282005 [Carcharodon carcharias]